MPDREKVIKALEVCVNNGFTSCEGCPYDYPDRVGCQAIDDALALLKEQQQQIWELQDQVEYLTDKLKEQDSEIERMKKPTAGDNKIPLKW